MVDKVDVLEHTDQSLALRYIAQREHAQILRHDFAVYQVLSLRRWWSALQRGHGFCRWWLNSNVICTLFVKRKIKSSNVKRDFLLKICQKTVYIHNSVVSSIFFFLFFNFLRLFWFLSHFLKKNQLIFRWDLLNADRQIPNVTIYK